MTTIIETDPNTLTPVVLLDVLRILCRRDGLTVADLARLADLPLARVERFMEGFPQDLSYDEGRKLQAVYGLPGWCDSAPAPR